jgi:hypothetical protein
LPLAHGALRHHWAGPGSRPRRRIERYTAKQTIRLTRYAVVQTFATNAKFKTAIDTALGAAGAGDPIRAALVAGIDQGETEHRSAARSADGSLNLRISDWVLRGQDLPVLQLIGIVGTAATAALAPGAIATAVVTALTSFAGLCWKTWRKGSPLSGGNRGARIRRGSRPHQPG